MKVSTILITGATGKTGQFAVEYLTKQGVTVRALAHHEGPKAESLRASGADVAIGDLLNINDVARAVEGIQNAYFCYPAEPRLIHATSYFALAAKEAGVKHIINMSQITARRFAKSRTSLNHWVAERIFDWSGISTTHLKPVFFAEWLTELVDPFEFRATGALELLLGDGRHAPVAAEDVGRLVAAILHKPESHVGKTYTVHGPTEMSHYDIAQAMSRALGREVHYEPVTFEEFAEEKLKGWPEFNSQHVREIARDYQNGVLVGKDGIIGQLTGKPPMSVEAFHPKEPVPFRIVGGSNI